MTDGSGPRHAASPARARRPWRVAVGAALVAAVAAAVLTGSPWTRATASVADTAPTAATSSGLLRGAAHGSVDTFRGVRYAQAPVGNRRLAPTEPAVRVTGDVDATRSGPHCLQSATPTAAESEDCLFLDVTRPAGTPRAPLPVIVWWHGGGFVAGSGSAFVPDRMVTRGQAVVVTVNYRLGDLGYLALPGLPGGGNFGFADQLESLRWVRENIAAFGGDAANVTVAGESAGALSVCLALASPAAAGLFDKAIMSSGACTLEWAAGTLGRGVPRWRPFVPRADAERYGVSRAATLGCTGGERLACLRGAPPTTFLRPSGISIQPPAYGTALVPANPVEALRTGAVNEVPVLSGSNHDEATLWVGLADRAQRYTASEYATVLSAGFGRDAGRVAQAYPSARHPSPGAAWAAVATDGSWACPTLAGNRLAAARMPVYAYDFADASAPSTTPGFPFGAYHGADLSYLFDVGVGLDDAQRALGDAMIAYWTTFARTGDPSSAGLPAMPRFDGATVTALAPGPRGVRRTDFAADHRCAFWGTVDATAGGSAS